MFQASGFIFLLLASASLAGPVTTVPWNGHTGAVSFTYDDARPSQLPKLLPQLDSLHIKATFEIAALAGLGNFTDSLAHWLQVSRNGHELANHTRQHINVTDSNAASTILDMATYLRGLDTSIQSVTFAYPNCSIPGTTGKNGVNAENFIGRGCNTTNYPWNASPQPDWMNIQGMILSPSNTSTAVTQINTAKTSNKWFITIVHDVTESPPDQYSITPANNLIMLNAALSAGVWIDTYSAVGAYYRAHFTMDTAQAVQNGAFKRLQWVSPHPKMPKSVPLRVKLDTAVFGDSAVVVQDGALVPRQSDGSYVVDFMKLKMDVYPKGTVPISPAAQFRRANVSARITGKVLRLEGVPAGAYLVEIRDTKGRLAERGGARVSGSGAQEFSLRAPLAAGFYSITLRQSSGETRRLPAVLTLQ